MILVSRCGISEHTFLFFFPPQQNKKKRTYKLNYGCEKPEKGEGEQERVVKVRVEQFGWGGVGGAVFTGEGESERRNGRRCKRAG